MNFYGAKDWKKAMKKGKKSDKEIALLELIFNNQAPPTTNKERIVFGKWEKKTMEKAIENEILDSYSHKTQMNTFFIGGFNEMPSSSIPQIEDWIFDTLCNLAAPPNDMDLFSFEPTVVAFQPTKFRLRLDGRMLPSQYRLQISGLFSHKTSMKWENVVSVITEMVQIAFNSIDY